ncbi:hypothetical protein PTSG_08274 [Salpingoeca rosetta]|uniref:Uncharacterized protein n=1 Tax=Salpingoeca rosetta (strain ATCC 50818 / BSB-021) TaxID=946362 RepID=F2UJ82_SALR5|nr:uncharacterized protein PTSG_08274 [Salpingoeca rosetta]EGD77181.1 hypothetical protein PTSG_08274 [Salpingoeca rosetta]|eukprot:XP_004990525.1 hypothetical protein PTSG_08274 [Salpingoeca rosetta]
MLVEHQLKAVGRRSKETVSLRRRGRASATRVDASPSNQLWWVCGMASTAVHMEAFLRTFPFIDQAHMALLRARQGEPIGEEEQAKEEEAEGPGTSNRQMQ